MEKYQPSRGLRGLAVFFSGLYGAAWGFLVLLLVAIPAIETFADRETLATFTLSVPVTAGLADARLESTWNGSTAAIGVDDTETTIRVPFWLAAPWFRATTYAFIGVAVAVALLFLFHLRAFFRSARDGTPFDPRNAGRLRWMGLLLLANHLLIEVFTTWQAATVLGTISSPPLALAPSFRLDGRIVLGGLMLLALAEIFKRGAALEDEQSLVV